MKKSVIALFCISFFPLTLSSCATTGLEKTQPAKTAMAGPQSHTVGIAADGGYFETCDDEWKSGNVVKFSFSSTKPVTFNVHYHGADGPLHLLSSVLDELITNA